GRIGPMDHRRTRSHRRVSDADRGRGTQPRAVGPARRCVSAGREACDHRHPADRLPRRASSPHREGGHGFAGRTAMTVDAIRLYRVACAQSGAAAGFYNHNIRVDTPDGPVIVRIPISGAERMDLRIWPEAEILAGIGGYIDSAPRLLHSSAEPAYQIHQYIPGD